MTTKDYLRKVEREEKRLTIRDLTSNDAKEKTEIRKKLNVKRGLLANLKTLFAEEIERR